MLYTSYTPDDYRALAHMFSIESKKYLALSETRTLLNQLVLDLHQLAIAIVKDEDKKPKSERD